MNETELTRQLTTFEELVKHLATKEDLALHKADVQKLRVELILWIIGTNVVVGGAIVSAMLYLNNQLINQFTFLLQHWKP
jgi:hypothetical protein